MKKIIDSVMPVVLYSTLVVGFGIGPLTAVGWFGVQIYNMEAARKHLP